MVIRGKSNKIHSIVDSWGQKYFLVSYLMCSHKIHKTLLIGCKTNS